MSKADTWMPLYIADYLRKTMHLTRDQHGAYLLLIMACWDRGGRLPNDPALLAAITKSTPAEWRRMAPVILAYFETDGADLVQGRVIEEHQKASRLSEIRRAAGQQGGRPRKEQTESTEKPKPKANPKANGSQTETPAYVAPPSPSTGPSDLRAVSNETDADAPSGRIEELRGLPLAKGCWGLALHVLVDRGRMADTKARSLIGKWKRDGLTDARLWEVAEAAVAAGTLDPVPYMAAMIERSASASSLIEAPSEKRQRAWAQDWLEKPFQWKTHERGPRPGEPGCQIAPEILAEFGIEPEAVH